MNKFICECGKVYEKDDEYTNWNYWVRCECGLQARLENAPVRSMPMTNFRYEGYNEGLGVNIRDKKHYDQVCKDQGVHPQ